MKRMTRNLKYIFIVLIFVFAGTSCMKEKLEMTYTNQESKIDQYINSNKYTDNTKTDSLRVVYNGGSARLVLKEGAGEELNANGTAAIYYAGYVFTSSPSKLFITNHQATAEKEKFVVTDPDYNVLEADMRNNDFVEGLYNGLIGVRAGEECEIAFTGKYGFGNVVFGTIPANSALIYRIWVIGVSNE